MDEGRRPASAGLNGLAGAVAVVLLVATHVGKARQGARRKADQARMPFSGQDSARESAAGQPSQHQRTSKSMYC